MPDDEVHHIPFGAAEPGSYHDKYSQDYPSDTSLISNEASLPSVKWE